MRAFKVYRHETSFGAYDVAGLTIQSAHFERTGNSIHIDDGEKVFYFRFHRVRNPIGAIIIRRRARVGFDISLGPDALYHACNNLEKIIGVRFRPGEVRFYKLERA